MRICKWMFALSWNPLIFLNEFKFVVRLYLGNISLLFYNYFSVFNRFDTSRQKKFTIHSWFVSECGILATCEAQENTRLIETAVSWADCWLIFRSGKPQCLVSQPSLLLSHVTWKKACSTIHHCTNFSLALCLPPSLSYTVHLFSSLTFKPSLTWLCVLYLTPFVIFVSHQLSFHCSSHLFFFLISFTSYLSSP